MSLTGARDPGHVGARRRGGVSLVCGSCMEREKASADTATGMSVRVAEGACRGGNEGMEYRRGVRRRTGP
jgi:hypothetical protein